MDSPSNQDQEIQPKSKPSKNFLIGFCLFFFGMSGLIGWNAIISSLDLFDYYHKEYSPSFLIPLISNFVNLGCQFLIIYHKKVASYKVILVTMVSLSMTLIVLCPFSVIFIPGLFGFYITMALILTQAGSNAFASSTFFSVISHLPKDYIILFSTGQGTSGLIVNMIKFIILWSVKIEDQKQRLITIAIIFYSISGFLLIITVILIFTIYQIPEFRAWLVNSGEFEQERIIIIHEESNLLPPSSIIDNIDSKQEERKGEEEEKDEDSHKNNEGKGFDFQRMKEVILKVLDIDLTIALLYLVSYSVYPSLIYDLPFFDLPIEYLNNTQTFIYNLSSMLSRQLTRLCKIQSKKTYTILTACRVIFLISFPLVIFIDTQKYVSMTILSIIILINLILCAGSSGFLATVGYYLAPQYVDESEKGICGGTIVLFQGLGLVLGSTISTFCMQYLKDFLKK